MNLAGHALVIEMQGESTLDQKVEQNRIRYVPIDHDRRTLELMQCALCRLLGDFLSHNRQRGTFAITEADATKLAGTKFCIWERDLRKKET